MLMISIEVMLCSMQLSLFSCISDALKESNLLSLFSYNTVTMQVDEASSPESIVYAVSYW